ncbi:MAG: hypothetical protein ACTS4W_00365 [Candidatus Hodgkinia cicadicola]
MIKEFSFGAQSKEKIFTALKLASEVVSSTTREGKTSLPLNPEGLYESLKMALPL